MWLKGGICILASIIEASFIEAKSVLLEARLEIEKCPVQSKNAR